MLCGDLNGKEIPKKRGYVCTCGWFTLQKVTQHCKAAILQSKKEKASYLQTSRFLRLCRQARKNWVAHIIRSYGPLSLPCKPGQPYQETGTWLSIVSTQGKSTLGPEPSYWPPTGVQALEASPKGPWTLLNLSVTLSTQEFFTKMQWNRDHPRLATVTQPNRPWIMDYGGRIGHSSGKEGSLRQGSLLAQKTQYISDNIVSVQ